MNLTGVVAQQLDFIQNINFNTTTYGPVEIFDTSIRHLGGLLSAYDMLKSRQSSNTYDPAQVETLLDQSVSLADKIAFGFITPTGLASTNVNCSSNEPVYGTYTIVATNQTFNSTNTASIGSFILEWFRLSDLTGNETYRQLSARAEGYLVDPSPPPVYPRLVGTQFGVDTGAMLTFDGGWQAGVDSFLEYLIKTYQYQITQTTMQYRDFWLQAAQSTSEHLAVHPYGFPDLTFLSKLDINGSITYSRDDFTCFAGGSCTHIAQPFPWSQLWTELTCSPFSPQSFSVRSCLICQSSYLLDSRSRTAVIRHTTLHLQASVRSPSHGERSKMQSLLRVCH